jgi:hypothetical protein
MIHYSHYKILQLYQSYRRLLSADCLISFAKKIFHRPEFGANRKHTVFLLTALKRSFFCISGDWLFRPAGGANRNAFLVGNLGLQTSFFISLAVSLLLFLGLLPSLNLLVYRHCGPKCMPPLITMHSPHPFGNWSLNFGEQMLSNRSEGPSSVITVHFIAEPT